MKKLLLVLLFAAPLQAQTKIDGTAMAPIRLLSAGGNWYYQEVTVAAMMPVVSERFALFMRANGLKGGFNSARFSWLARELGGSFETPSHVGMKVWQDCEYSDCRYLIVEGPGWAMEEIESIVQEMVKRDLWRNLINLEVDTFNFRAWLKNAKAGDRFARGIDYTVSDTKKRP